MKTIFVSLVIFSLTYLIAPHPARADLSSPDPSGTVVNITEVLDNIQQDTNFRFGSNTTIGFIFSTLLPYLYAIAGFGLLIYLVAAGFGYLMAIGDAKKMEQAQSTLTNAVMGFLIIVTAYWLTGIVNYIFNLGVGIQ